MGEPLRCTLTYASLQDLRNAWASFAGSCCFVPWPDDVEPGRAVVIRLYVEGQGSAELDGRVVGADFDDVGNVGISVELSPEAQTQLMSLRPAPSAPPQDLFTTSRLQVANLATPAASPAMAGVGDTSIRPVDPGTRPMEAVDPDAMLPPGTMLEDRFQIESHIASGGMGDVYRALHIHLKRPVALKLLKTVFAADVEMWGRFKREAELVSQLESPHIVRVFDFGKTKLGQPYLAMEFVEGARLDELIDKGPLEVGRAVTLLSQIFVGLEEAHALGIIHRDLKPPNIIIGRKRDGSESAKILDFGIARLADNASNKENKLTQMGMVVGTPAYLAPEQALAAQMDERTDIYAMGCVAYELLTGKPPFVSESLQQVISMHLTQPPAPLPSRRPELSAWPRLCAAIVKALEKEKEHRFPNIKAFRLELEQALAAPGPGPSAAPPPANLWGAPPPPASAPTTNPGWGPQGVPPGTTPGWSPQGTPAAQASPPGWPAAPAAAPSGPDGWSTAAPPPPPAPAWAPAPPSAPALPPAPKPEAIKAADDFFGASAPRAPRAAGTSGSTTSKSARLRVELKALKVDLPDSLVDAHVVARDAIGGRDTKGALARVEVLGPAPSQPLFAASLARVFEIASAWKGVVDEIDEDGLTLVFMGEPAVSLTRATRALGDMRDALADEAARVVPAGVVNLRASVVGGVLDVSPSSAVTGDIAFRARKLLGRVPAGTVALERAEAALVADVAELKPVPQTDLLEVTGRKGHLKRVEPPRVGRDALVAAFDKRLAAMAQGLMPPLVARGAKSSGRSMLLEEFATRARQKGLVVGIARGAASLKLAPFGGLTEVLCSLVGVPPHQWTTTLRRAVEALKLPPGGLEAVLALTGLAPLPQPLTTGQAVYALRVAVRGVAGDRGAVLAFDGLEAMDAQTVEAFRELSLHPAPRELVVGVADAEVSDERLGGAPAVALPPLTSAELAKWASTNLDGVPSAGLLDFLMKKSNGWPGSAVDWLLYLDDTGALRERDGQLHPGADVPDLDGPSLLKARLEALPLEVRRILEAAAVVGDTFEAQALTTAWPRATAPGLQRTALSRFIRTLGNRQWMYSSPRVEQAVALAPSESRPGMHLRVVATLLEQAKQNPQGADAVRMAMHFTAGGDGARAAPLWKHATETALARHAHRDAVRCIRGWSDALALVPGGGAQLAAGRVDALARAAGIALVLQDASQARALVDEAQALATKSGLTSAELALATARVFRSEARRAKAAESLAQAEAQAVGTSLEALVEAERGESRELEGDMPNAIVAFEKALALAPAAAELARWHGEVDLAARLEARLGSISLQRKEMLPAKRLFESSLTRWRAAGWPFAEARVLANLGTMSAMLKDSRTAAGSFAAASQAAARCGDTMFQARMLIQQAKALKLGDGAAQAKQVAAEAKKLCLAIGWAEGQAQADALMA